MARIDGIANSSPDVLAASIELGWRHFDETGDPCPLAFALWPDLILDTFQQDILRSMLDPTIRDLYVKGCTASGKTSSVALGICLYFVVHDDAKVILTSVTADHVVTTLFNEVASWWKAMVRKPPGAVLQAEGIWHSEEHFLVCVNPKNAEAFRGKHAPHTLICFDEGTGILDERFDLADTQATDFVAMSNPSTMAGRFRLAFSLCRDPDQNETVLGPYGYRRCLTIDGADCFNVKMKRLERPVAPIGGIEIAGHAYKQGDLIPPEHYELVAPLIPGQLCYDTYMAHCAKPDARWVNTFAHGMFPKDDPEIQVILDSWLDRHILAYQAHRPAITAFGLDVAASEHGAETVLAGGSEEGCGYLDGWRQRDLMATVWNVLNRARDLGIDLKRGDVPVCVDVVGVGAGVADRLTELGVQVIRFNGAEKANNPELYGNARAEGYGELGRRLDPQGVHANTPWALPPDSLLRADLCAPEKIYDSGGFRYYITPKARKKGMPENKPTVEEKLGRSPDKGDAVVNLYRAVALARRPVSDGLSVYDIRTAVQLPGPADEPARRLWRDAVGAIYQHDQRSPVAFVALGCRASTQQIGLLLVKTWEHTVSKQKVAEDIGAFYRRLNLLGVAFDPSRSFYLADELAILPTKVELYESPLTADRRKKIGQLLQWYLPEQRIQLYQDERLINQLIRLPVSGKAEGYVLGDVEAAGGQLESAVALAMAVYWAHGTMAS